MTNAQSTAWPWCEDDVYAAVHAQAVTNVLDDAPSDPDALRLDLTVEQAEGACQMQLYRHGAEILDVATLVLSESWTAYHAELYAAFHARPDLASPVVVVNCTPTATEPVYRYAALAQRPTE